MNKRICTILAAALTAACARAAVPLKWTVETSRVQPVAIEAYHGETLALEATLQSYGKPVADDMQNARIFWQTNGMGSAYWSAPASAEGGVLRATWTPEMDTGANAVNGFIGISGEIYRASFQLRLRPSPGAEPSMLQLPVKTLDFAQIEVLNAPWENGGGVSCATDGQAVTNIVDGIISEKLAHVPNDTHLHHIEDLKGFTDFSNSTRSKLDLTVYATTTFRIGCISYFDGGDGSKIVRRGEVLGHDGSRVFIRYFCDALKTKETAIVHDYWSGEATTLTIDGVMIFVGRAEMFGLEHTETDDELSTKSYVDGIVLHEKENILSMIADAVKDVKASAVNLEDKALGRKWELTANDGVFTFTLIEEPVK